MQNMQMSNTSHGQGSPGICCFSGRCGGWREVSKAHFAFGSLRPRPSIPSKKTRVGRTGRKTQEMDSILHCDMCLQRRFSLTNHWEQQMTNMGDTNNLLVFSYSGQNIGWSLVPWNKWREEILRPWCWDTPEVNNSWYSLVFLEHSALKTQQLGKVWRPPLK